MEGIRTPGRIILPNRLVVDYEMEGIFTSNL